MALIKVRWQVTEEHEAEIEIDGYDPDDPDLDLDDAVLAEHEDEKSYVSTPDRGILSYEVIRAGDQVLSEAAAKIVAPPHEPDWDD